MVSAFTGCKVKYEDWFVSDDHVWGEWVTAKEPTCTEDGRKEAICTECEVKGYEAIPALGHVVVHVDATVPNCTEDGNVEHYLCTRCGDGFVDAECKQKLPSVVIPALGHDYVHHAGKNASCTEIGWDAYVTCSRCDYTTYEEIPAFGHNYVDHVCSICGEEEPSTEGVQFTLNKDEKGYTVTGYKGTATEVYIAPTYQGLPVTAIGDYAFIQSDITSIELPETLTNIGEGAFALCSSLTSIDVAEGNTSLKSIDGNLYSYDGKTLVVYAPGKKDTSFTVPADVTAIAATAFFACETLTTVTFEQGSNLTSIGDKAFYDCEALTSIELPDGVTTIGESAFYYCSSLTSIELPASLTAIGGSAFSYSGLTTVTFAKETNLTSFGDYAFAFCNSLTSIELPATLTTIGNYAFYGCKALTSIELPATLTTIGNYAFGYSTLTSIELPDSVTTIGENAFAYTSITSIELPETVTTIGDYAFSGTGLTYRNSFFGYYYR